MLGGVSQHKHCSIAVTRTQADEVAFVKTGVSTCFAASPCNQSSARCSCCVCVAVDDLWLGCSCTKQALGNVKWMFMVGIFIFEAGSVLCAAATGSSMFIVGRAIVGCGAAGVYSGVMTMVGFSAPLEKRPTYIASVVSMFAVAAIVGPLVGGALTQSVSWRWCFWINPFIGVASVLAVLLFFTSPKRKAIFMTFSQKICQLDLPGCVSCQSVSFL